jgi:hypothetical protein
LLKDKKDLANCKNSLDGFSVKPLKSLKCSNASVALTGLMM